MPNYIKIFYANKTPCFLSRSLVYYTTASQTRRNNFFSQSYTGWLFSFKQKLISSFPLPLFNSPKYKTLCNQFRSVVKLIYNKGGLPKYAVLVARSLSHTHYLKRKAKKQYKDDKDRGVE